MSENNKENPQLPKNEETENPKIVSEKGGTRGGKIVINETAKSGTTGG